MARGERGEYRATGTEVLRYREWTAQARHHGAQQCSAARQSAHYHVYSSGLSGKAHLHRVELLSDGKLRAHLGKGGGGVAVRVNVPARRPPRGLLGHHCRVRPRGGKGVALEVESHARVVQPEVDRVGHLDARQVAGRPQVSGRHRASTPIRLDHVLPAAPLRHVDVHDGLVRVRGGVRFGVCRVMVRVRVRVRVRAMAVIGL